MLSIILDWQKKEYQFMGKKITCEIRSLNRRAMIDILPFQTRHPGSRSLEQLSAMTDNERAEYANNLEIAALEMQGYAAKVFPDHVRNVEGVEINGKTPTAEQFAEEVVLLNLTTSIMTDLLKLSTLTRSDEGNSEGASGNGQQVVDAPIN